MQSKALEKYLLKERDLRPLGSLLRRNPQHKSWSAMRLYLETQVEATAYEKWGGAEGLEAERRRQIRARAAMRKRRGEGREREEAEAKAKLQRLEEELRATRTAPEVHVHEFIDTPGPGGVTVRKCTICGVEVSVEEI